MPAEEEGVDLQLPEEGRKEFPEDGSGGPEGVQRKAVAHPGALRDVLGGNLVVPGLLRIQVPDSPGGYIIFEYAFPAGKIVQGTGGGAECISLDRALDGESEAESRAERDDGRVPAESQHPDGTGDDGVHVVQESHGNPVGNPGEGPERYSLDGRELVVHPEDSFLVVERARDGHAQPAERRRLADGQPQSLRDLLPRPARTGRDAAAVGALDGRAADVQQPVCFPRGQHLRNRPGAGSCGCVPGRRPGSR